MARGQRGPPHRLSGSKRGRCCPEASGLCAESRGRRRGTKDAPSRAEAGGGGCGAEGRLGRLGGAETPARDVTGKVQSCACERNSVCVIQQYI